MPGYKTLEELMISGRGAGRAAFETEAVKNQRNVGALQINHPAKKGISLEEATKRHNAIMESGGYHQDSSGKSITPHPTTSGSLKSQDAAQQKVVDKFKAGSKLTGDKLIAGAGHLQSILAGAQQAFGEGEIIGMGSGYAMQQGGYNPEMYIGQGMGY